MSMTGKIEHVEVITSVQRRRRWSAEEKAAIVQETYAPGMSVSRLINKVNGVGFEYYRFAGNYPTKSVANADRRRQNREISGGFGV